MTTALSLEEVKTRQQKTWSSGDYGKVAWITVPLADALCEAAEVGCTKGAHLRGRRQEISGGERGIRTLGRALRPYGGLANRWFKPLTHLSAGVGVQHGE